MNLDSCTIFARIHAWPRNFLSRLREEAFSANGSLQSLLALGDELQALGNSTEGEFLSIGEKLQGFYQRAGDISKISSTVAQLMSGDKLGAAIEGFRNVVDRMKRLEGESRRNTKILRDVLEYIARLDRHVDGFRKTTQHLRVLCVSTRIESARLGDRSADFESLADEVGKLSSEIENRCFQLLASSNSLSHLIGQVLARVLDLETTQQTQAGIVFENTMSSLESLLKKHALSATSAGEISTRYEAVSQRIGQIVLSMQFHDITRQRIEHVQQALAGLYPLKQSAGNAGQLQDRGFLFGDGQKRKAAQEHSRLVGDVTELQIAQLLYARDELVSAVNNILDNLSALADLVAETAQETSKMAGANDETEQSFLAGVEAGFSSVTSALKTYGVADRELSLATGSGGACWADSHREWPGGGRHFAHRDAHRVLGVRHRDHRPLQAHPGPPRPLPPVLQKQDGRRTRRGAARRTRRGAARLGPRSAAHYRPSSRDRRRRGICGACFQRASCSSPPAAAAADSPRRRPRRQSDPHRGPSCCAGGQTKASP